MVSYWTAYLKANYPAEFMAGLLTSVQDDKDKMAIYLNECRRMGIQVLPPDVDRLGSQLHSSKRRRWVRVDRGWNVGHNVVDGIVGGRDRARQGGELPRIPGFGPAGSDVQQAGNRVRGRGLRVGGVRGWL